MIYSRHEALDRLLNAYRRFYTVTRFDGGTPPEAAGPDAEDRIREAAHLVPDLPAGPMSLRAVCEYYERTGQHLLLRQNEIWAARQEEFIFLFEVPELTPERFGICRDFAYEKGMAMAHIGPEHMYTYISPVFVCDTVTAAARRELEKCRIYKTFRFSLHGWMDFHAACYDASQGVLYFNKAGTCMKESLEEVLLLGRKARKGLSRFFL